MEEKIKELEKRNKELKNEVDFYRHILSGLCTSIGEAEKKYGIYFFRGL